MRFRVQLWTLDSEKKGGLARVRGDMIVEAGDISVAAEKVHENVGKLAKPKRAKIGKILISLDKPKEKDSDNPFTQV